MECVRACGPGALLHGERDAEMDIDVGAVVMATGFDLSVPGPNNEYGYERYANVLSALEYERMLSASGPTIGSVQRRDNGKHPKKIAFIQCVGSRDQEHEYCSSVCCSFANKQAMLTIDHEPDCEPTVFLMDMRAQGKGFDAFYQRAIDKGVKFVRSRPSYIKEDPLTGDLLISWEDEAGKMHETRYDMVVLSAGLEPARKAQEAAGHVGVALNRHGFCELHEFNPLETSRKGVFVVGPFGEPKDIPDSVAQASAAAAQVMTGLADSRGTLTVDKEYPDEKNVRRRGAARRRLRLPLRQQHRRRHRRRERRRVRQPAARRGVRHRHHVHVLVGQPHAHPRRHRGAQPQPRRRRQLHAAHARAHLPGHPARGRPQPVPLRDGQHPRPGELGARQGAGEGHAEGQGAGPDERGPGPACSSRSTRSTCRSRTPPSSSAAASPA